MIIYFTTIVTFVSAGTTGKISGNITDVITGKALIGCNVMIPVIGIGAASDLDGNYVILNIPPGKIDVNFSMIGYAETRIKNVTISIDQTTPLSIQLNVEAIEGQTIIVRDERLIRMDRTSTEARITSEELDVMPVTDVYDVIKLQGGITQDAYGGIHIRGGRSNEVVYMVDGVSMTDSYDGGLSIAVENNTIQELQVISGTFNAEYGRAMSGIINMVTKDGSDQFEGAFRSFSGDHISTDPIYRNLDSYNPFNQRNVEMQVSGPILKNKLTYFASGRYYGANGWLSGMNTFSMYGDTLINLDYAPMNGINKYSLQNKLTFSYSPYTKLKFKYITNKEQSQGYDHYRQMTQEGRNTNFNKGNFLGINLSHTFSSEAFMEFNISRHSKKFQSYLFENENDPRYVTPDSLYYAHITGELSQGIPQGTNYYPSHSFGRWGVDMNRFMRETITNQLKLDFTRQLNVFNQFKLGIEVQFHQLELDSYALMDSSSNDLVFTPVIPQLGAEYDISGNVIPQLSAEEKLQFSEDIPSWVSHFHVNRSYYQNSPKEMSAFIQDKIEYGDMIINLGLRYDYFDPNSWVPVNPHDPYIQNPRDPHLDSLSVEELLEINWGDISHYIIDFDTKDTLWYRYADYGSFSDMGDGEYDSGEEFVDTNSNEKWDQGEAFTDESEIRTEKGWYRKTTAKSQLSPRFGIAYPISDKGVIHFSYGYFFQIPQFENLYRDPGYKISEGSGTFGVFGNPDLEPQKTISYELGLQHELGNNYKMELTGYFRDVRDWVSTGVPIDLGGGATYYTFVNKDYSNVRGILGALDRKYSGLFSWHMDYTFQIVEGSNSSPEEEFGAQLSNSEPARSIIPLDWDQRHSLNASVFVGTRMWGANVIMQYGSGYPYTPYFLNSSQNVSMFSSRNSMRKMTTLNFDMKVFRNFKVAGLDGRILINIYNLFDRRNENIVWGDTGRSGQTSEEGNALLIESAYPEVLRPNSIADYFNHPEWYSEPRQIQVGLEFSW